jgi:spermidine/putrescine transport system ATP-binding protein
VGITFVLVTHDQEEALTMSDRIAVMFDGKISQLDTPEGIYKKPADQRVASFIGVMNFLPAQVTSASGKTLDIDVAAFGKLSCPKDDRFTKGDKLKVGIRPEMLTIVYDGEKTDKNCVAAKVTDIAYYGDMTYYEVVFEDGTHSASVSMRNTAGRTILPIGAITHISWGPESIVLLED